MWAWWKGNTKDEIEVDIINGKPCAGIAGQQFNGIIGDENDEVHKSE